MKEYIKPRINTIKTETPTILAGSGNVINKASDADYKEDEVKKLWDKDEQIWAD